MLAKYWKKIGLIVLVIFCLMNGISKLVKVVSFDSRIDTIKSKMLISQKK